MSTNTPVVLQLTQGQSRDFARATPNDDGSFGGVFAGTETITYTVWPADSQTPVLTLAGAPNQWVNASLTQWLISFSDGQTTALVPGEYNIEVAASPQAGRTATLFRGLLEVFSASGTAATTDLITAYYCLKLLAGSALTAQQVEAIPDLITAASKAIESFCMRTFAQATVVEDLEVSLYGEIRMSRPPVNQVYRVQGSPRVALTISNGSATQAWTSAATTGDLASGQTITGLVLSSQAAGVTSSQTIVFASLADQQIGTLATAINAVGGGWSASPNSSYASLSISEIINLGTGLGASPNDVPIGAARYLVYSEVLTEYVPKADGGERTGIYVVGRRRGYSDAARWGPGGEELFGGPGGSGERWPNRVKVTYNGGFTTIPREVQLACVELVKVQLERLKTDLLLRGETAGKYSYEINDAQILALPKHILTALCRHRITNA